MTDYTGFTNQFQIPWAANAWRISSGPANTLYFTSGCEGCNWVGKITLGAQNVFKEYVLSNSASYSRGVALGPDGREFFVDQGGNAIGIIYRGSVSEATIPTPNSGAEDITVGADHGMWFTESNVGQIGRADERGNIVEYRVGGSPLYIIGGPDGDLWYTDPSPSTQNTILRLTTSGQPGESIQLPQSAYIDSLVVGPDKNVWVGFEDSFGNIYLAEVTSLGFVTIYPMPNGLGGGKLLSLAAGLDGNIWGAGSGSIDVFVRLTMVPSPTSLTFANVGQTLPLSVTEANYLGSFGATSSNQNIVQVTNGPNKHTFLVTAEGTGTATITLYDKKQNDCVVAVTVP